jgi:alkylation response protein AidB-like acyl-CoA dehydrogenase
MTAPFSPLEVAQRIADELLFPTALEVDAGDRVPGSHLDRLAAAGLYGLFGPAEAGGLAADPTTGLKVVEELAGGCLTTTFVWIQHHSALLAVANSTTPGLRERWLEDLCRGKCRAGIAIVGLRPGAAGVSAQAVDGGWLVNGTVPWVTGWGLIDVMHVVALAPGAQMVWALLDAVESPTLSCQRLRLVAVNGSVTVAVRFEDHFVAAERVTGVESATEWAAQEPRKLRTNGSLALGVARRCCRLLGPGPLDACVAACRVALDHAAVFDLASLPAARAAASHLAYRAAGDLVVATGSRSVLRDQHPQRLAREAMFLLVAAGRPAIREELRQLFEQPPASPR